MAERLGVHEQQQPTVMVDPFDLDATPTGNGHIDVLTRCPRAPPRLPGSLRDLSHEACPRLKLEWGQEFGLGDRLRERHAQTIGAERDTVSNI